MESDIAFAKNVGFPRTLFVLGRGFEMKTPSMRSRLVSRALDVSLAMLSHARFMKSVDLAQVLTDKTERLLNLPGRLPSFPTKPADPKAINALLQKLHPVACDRELVRLGPEADGGYLVPNDFDGIEACFSPGVSTTAGFEQDCARMGMKVFMADASVEGPPEDHSQFRFLKKFIGSATRGDFLSIEEWVNDAPIDRRAELLLQMDIEGYEYETLLSLPINLQQRFRIIVVEFHYLDYLFSEPLFAIHSKAFDKILCTHSCVHIHPNNVCGSLRVGELEIPQMAEFTFLRHDRISNPVFATNFPHPLDRDNTGNASLRLPRSCYRAA